MSSLPAPFVDTQDKSEYYTRSKNVKKPSENYYMEDFQYVRKLRSAVYVFILFSILSQKVAYKILDIIFKVFSNTIDITDENENPTFVGTIAMATICAFIIFIF